MSETFEKPRVINNTLYSVSFQNLLDIWIETMHPGENVVAVWDVKNHYDILENSGFIVDKTKTYDNKILTIVVEDIRDAIYVMDVITAHETHPFVQIYKEGRLLTDNIDSKY